jgi:superfamily I DNA/RNA helicase
MGFRGALATNMVDFRNIFNAEIAELTYNFRCDTNIINVANSFLNGEATLDPFSTNPGHVSYTEFDTQNQELDWIARSIDGMVG